MKKKPNIRVYVAIIEWNEYPEDKDSVHTEIWDLREDVFTPYMLFANGVINELRVEGENQESIDALRGIVMGGGSAIEISLSSEQKANMWLYRDGYKCYQQGQTNPAYFFINPVPQPHLFTTD